MERLPRGKLAVVAALALLTGCGGGGGGSGGAPPPEVNAPPVASFSATPSSGTVPLAVQFDASSSTDAGGSIVAYTWSFGDNTSNAIGVTTSHVFQTAGTFNVALTVTDNAGATGSAARLITVTNIAVPNVVGQTQALATATLNGAGLVVGSVSSEASDVVPAGNVISQNPTAGALVLPGTSVNLVISSGPIVRPPPNSPPVSNPGPAQSVAVGVAVVLDGSASADADGDPLAYMWSLTSKPTGSAAVLRDATSARAIFTPDVAGIYIAVLMVNDGKTNSAPATVAVTATAVNRAPVADAGTSQKVGLGAVVTLDGSRSYDPDGDPLTYSWTLAATPSTSLWLEGASSVKPSFTPAYAGVYVATLVVNDGKVSSSSAAVEIVANPVGYRIVDLGTLGGLNSEATDINSKGQVIGWAENSAGKQHAFLYSDGKMLDLGTLGGLESVALDINDNGEVVGWAQISTGERRAFLYSNGTMVDLGTLGGGFSTAYAINNAGQIAGEARTAHLETHAFLYSAGKMIDLGTLGGPYGSGRHINEAGQVAGVSHISTRVWDRAFLYSGGSMINLGTLGGDYIEPFDMNNLGQVVGLSNPTGTILPHQRHAFLFSGGQLIDLGTLGGQWSIASAINDAGQITGSAYVSDLSVSQNAVHHAYLYANGKMTDLGTLGGNRSWGTDINETGQVVGSSNARVDGSIVPFVFAEGRMIYLGTLGGGQGSALAINAAQQVVGTADVPTRGSHAFLATPVPD